MEANNMAAMRDALEIAKKAICHHARKNHTCDSLAWESSTINANCGDILCAHRDLCEAKTAIQKALAAPLRNCDRFKTRKEARNYFDDFVCLRSNGSGAIDCKGCPLDSIDSPHRADCREAWLFATATEGGAE